jgi:hypothetical protein
VSKEQKKIALAKMMPQAFENELRRLSATKKTHTNIS